MTSESFLRHTTYDGLSKRFDRPPKAYLDRVAFELDAISKAKFCDYFLIMWDMYEFMREAGIAVGAGRGSACGSLVCYSLGITDVDPIEYGLLFERFINPERVSLPDIDCDISQARRGEVVEYLRERWGADRVCMISTYQTMGARAAIRDVGRVLGKPLELCDRIAKMIPLEGSITVAREDRHYLADAVANNKEIAAIYSSNANAKEIIDQAMEMEGLLKAVSTHAAGVVISDAPISEYIPVLTTKAVKGKERPQATGYTMNHLEEVGLIKFDLLGLRNVDIVAETIAWAVADGALPSGFTKHDIPFDDPSTYKMLAQGKTAGCFQIEGSSMTGWMRKLQPDCIDDIIAMISLFRPGPMEQIPDYIDRKHGKAKVEYPHPSLEEVLEPTFGTVIYQEQIMKIGQIIAGWSLSRADQLRKVIGKKIVEKIIEEKTDFVRDAVKQGHNKQWATDLFEYFIEPAGKYVFNQSHATAYAFLTVQTAWLKCHVPTHFFAALLKSVSGKFDKIAGYINEARAVGVAILPPDVNLSDKDFTPSHADRSIRFGLCALKNVGDDAVKLIMKERKKGQYSDLFDFIDRTKNRLITTRTVESIALAGGFDTIHSDRGSVVASVEVGFNRAKMMDEDKQRIAAGKLAVKRKVQIPESILVTGTLDDAKLLASERDIVGLYLSSHPYHAWSEAAEKVASLPIQDALLLGDGMPVVIVGIVTAIKEIKTKKGMKMCTAVIEDDRTSIEAVVFPRQYSEVHPYLVLDMPVVLRGKASIESDGGYDDSESVVTAKILVEKAGSLNAAPSTNRLVKQSDDNEFVRLMVNDYWPRLQEIQGRQFSRITLVLPNDEQITLDSSLLPKAY